jgi:hypothetical protein
MQQKESLSHSFGYFEGSKSNLLQLMEEHNLLSDDFAESVIDETVPQKLMPEMTECFRLYPKRSILNPLVEFFFRDVNWMYEMLHPTLFLGLYEKWWQCVPGSTSESLHFSVLILRVCAYSAQFSPSSLGGSTSLSGEMPMGVPLEKIRTHCHDLAARLQRLCEQLRAPTSLIWVQQLFYAACYEKNDGSIKHAWFTLGHAIRAVQDMGLHVEDSRMDKKNMNDLEYDMGRRAFWNLYIWDRFLSLVLDRAPCIVDSHCSTELPKMRLLNSILGDGAPDVFTERMLQAKLSKLWSSLNIAIPYDPVASEEAYAKLSRSFISQLPTAFDVHAPDRQWDSKLPHLSRQRHTLYIAIYIGMGQIFQPLLSLRAEQVDLMLQFKRDLLVQHRELLVRSAIRALLSLNEVYQLMGGKTHRFFMLGFCTFQAAMLLCLHLLTLDASQQAPSGNMRQMEQQFPGSRIFQACMSSDLASPQTCRQHIEQALSLLRSLQTLNTVARVGVRKLEQVLIKLDVTTVSDDGIAAHDWLGFEMQQLSDSEQPPSIAYNGLVDLPVNLHTQNEVEDPYELWDGREVAHWMAEDFCNDL